MTVTKQDPPAERAHVPAENKTEPVPPVCVQVIVSPDTVPEKPVKVAVHFEVEPTDSGVEAHETDAVGEASGAKMTTSSAQELAWAKAVMPNVTLVPAEVGTS